MILQEDHVYIVEPEIRDLRGHYAEYTRAVCQELARRGVAYTVLASEGADREVVADLSARPVLPALTSRTFAEVSGMSRIAGLRAVGGGFDALLANLRLYRAVRAAVPRVRAGSIFFAPSADHRQLLAWALLLKRWRSTEARLVIMLRYGTRRTGNWKRVWRWVLRACFLAIEVAGRREGLTLATDSAQLAEEYHHVTRLPIAVWPIPHTGDVGFETTREPCNRVSDSPLHLVWLSEPRDERGFPVLVTAIEWLARTRQLGSLRFTIQRNRGGGELGQSVNALHRLDALGLRNVTFTYGPLSRPEYMRLLLDADVILLPYVREVYASRTSGPFTEALAFGRPVIVTDRTWMSQTLKQNGAGLEFKDNDPVSLGETMLEASRKRNELLKGALAARRGWISTHNPAALVDRLLLSD